MTDLKQTVNRWIRVYLAGCCCFAVAALAAIAWGYWVASEGRKYDWPMQILILSGAGCWLLWEMGKALRWNTKLPDCFRPVSVREYPELFAAINEVTDRLQLSPIEKVYVSPDAAASVFIQPRLRNLLCEPKRNLVIGLGFLTQMDDDEIRAVLYHEFGHYVQDGMKSSLSAYAVGQFSRSFLSIREKEEEGVWKQQLRVMLLWFTQFTLWICTHIDAAYSQLARQMEYEADDVAVKYVGAATLQRTLLHAACIRYNYDVLRWGLRQLESQNLVVDNLYEALRLVERYSRPSRALLPTEVIRRMERVGKLKLELPLLRASRRISVRALQMVPQPQGAIQVCPAARMAQWMRGGFLIYGRQRKRETAVKLEIHLDRKKHRLPWMDATYRILLDGKDAGTGNFLKGYTIRKRTAPGKHVIMACAPSGIVSTPSEFEVGQDGTYRVEMDYKLHVRDGMYDVFAAKIFRL
ncbi:M48 family metallopeptidase [Mediterranea massiliensis]|uniref:M48 family metallopeptidase n=1 Tax=Mediterranea massiliensis TaxID=1841865 RepID=UPI0023F3CA8B|nr:M48 family metallopeptidase [Mediterranea massiliensis]